MRSVAIVDYGMCNLDSVARAVEECGGAPRVTDSERDIREATHVILPGVGSFADAMHNIRERRLDDILEEHVRAKEIPFLGICLGMQLLATRGLEGGENAGLGWIAGDVVPLKPSETERIPHIGWNEVNHDGSPLLLQGIPSGKDFYFVHSFHFVCQNAADVVTTTPYCGSFTSCVGQGPIWGTQFHPEKSQRPGFQLLRNFLSL